MTSQPHILLLFQSIHQVLCAEKLLQGQGIWCDLVPTPKEISSNCGMSLEVLESDRCRLEPLKEKLQWTSMLPHGSDRTSSSSTCPSNDA
jgi:hypothetical protein